MKKCLGCSANVADDANFCTNCGSNQFAVEYGTAVPTQQTQQTYNMQPNQQPQNNVQSQQFNQQVAQQYQQPYPNMGQQGFGNNQMPLSQDLTFKDFVEKFASEKHRKNIKTTIIFFYVCAALTAVLAIAVAAMNGIFPAGIIDAVILAGLTLGLQKTKKKAFIIAILVLSIIEFIFGIVSSGTPSGFLWLVNSIFLLKTYKELNKEYQQFKSSVGNSTNFNNGIQ